MSFYLKPPRGEIHLEKALSLALKRMEFLFLLPDHVDGSSESPPPRLNPAFGESTTEGTAKDRVAHFMLKLAATAGPARFRQFFVSREIDFFLLRLRDAYRVSKHRNVCELQRHLRDRIRAGHRHISGHLSATDMRCLHDSVSVVAENGLCLGRESAEEEVNRVPFYLVSSLVSRRRVRLENGQAVITTAVLDAFLACVFEHFLVESIDSPRHLLDASESEESSSKHLVEAILSGFDALSRRHFASLPSSSANLLAREVDAEAEERFPPCFGRVHRRLVSSHRLPHHDRVAYTLFLKEAGLPLEEALKFWAHHYSKSPEESGSCSHDWQKDRRRFVYSIRHLYGMEGGRKRYSGHSCEAIRNRADSSVNSVLACPFAAVENGSICDAGCDLASEKVLTSVRLGQCQQACLQSFRSRTGFKDENENTGSCDSDTSSKSKTMQFRKPSEFYLWAKTADQPMASSHVM